MQKRKILLTAVFMSFWILQLYAQEPAAAPAVADSLNFYQQLIEELESKGVNMQQLLDSPAFVEKLQEEGYNRDSLAYYYELTKLPIGSDQVISEDATIGLLGKSYRDSIVLRWGPSSLELWRRLNKTGYSVARIEMKLDANGKFTELDTNSYRVLADTLAPIKPWTLERIGATLKDSDTSAWVAAQALYGETFGEEADAANLDFVARNRANEMRFGFSMLMADRSALAADLLGVRYVDKTVQPGKTYIYYVIPVDSLRRLTTLAFVKNDPAANQKVEEVKTEIGDGKIKISWPKDRNAFSGYWIERSEDNGNTWEKLTEEVIVFMNDGPIPPRNGDMLLTAEVDPTDGAAGYYVFLDSTTNDINYTYRLSGQTPFADFTDYTYVKAMSTDQTPPPVPQIEKHSVDEKTNIATLVWNMNFDADLIEDLAGFSVWETPNPDSAYVQISGQLPPETRSFQSPKPLEKDRIHYYILKAVDKKGNETSTFPLYMHVIDEIAPAAPSNPDYVIDSTGVVTLVWDHNTEADLLGYRVYFTNNPDYELTQLTAAPISRNMYQDTIEIVTLTEKIYYTIQAVDRSHNRSDFSVMVEVRKPDVIPPVAPILHYPDMNDSMIYLTWRPSSSEDVVGHILYRRSYQTGEDWTVLGELGGRDTSFMDQTAAVEEMYEYSLRAKDDAGLLSEFAFPVKGRRWFEGTILNVENLQAMYDSTAKSIRLDWKFSPPQYEIFKNVDYVYYIYRSIGTAPVIRYRTIESQLTSFNDLKIKAGEQYNYALMVVFMNGKSSGLSEQRSVIVKSE
jgi:hypothetical protein